MKKAVFIDLQGTLGGDPIGDISNFSFYSSSKEAINIFKQKGYLVFVVTNQSRIAKGFLTLEEFETRRDEIMLEVDIDGFYSCPHSREDNCICKKPKRGMIDKILEKHDIDINESYVIGDMGISDMLLAKNINSKSILVLTGAGKGSLDEYRHTWEGCEPTYVAENILDAARII